MRINRFTCSSFLAAGILLCAATTTHARLAGNTLAPDKLAANHAAASTLAASELAVDQLGPNEYVLDPNAASALLATEDGREVLSFIVSCALPEATRKCSACSRRAAGSPSQRGRRSC
jgi:hypothetical protein